MWRVLLPMQIFLTLALQGTQRINKIRPSWHWTLVIWPPYCFSFNDDQVWSVRQHLKGGEMVHHLWEAKVLPWMTANCSIYLWLQLSLSFAQPDCIACQRFMQQMTKESDIAYIWQISIVSLMRTFEVSFIDWFLRKWRFRDHNLPCLKTMK